MGFNALGSWQVPIELLVCAIPDPLRGGEMLRALADTPNDDVLETVAAQALLDAAWRLVQQRKIFDITCEVVNVFFTCSWIFWRDHSGLWPCLVFCFMKEVAEKNIEFTRACKKGWEVPPLLLLGTLLNVTLYVLLLYQALEYEDYPHERLGQIPIAIWGCMRWWSLLGHLRGFKAIGPRILPILFALGSMGPFFMVCFIIMLGFLSSFYALADTDADAQRVRGIYLLAMLGDTGFLGRDACRFGTTWRMRKLRLLYLTIPFRV